jgi:hypothetical protein
MKIINTITVNTQQDAEALQRQGYSLEKDNQRFVCTKEENNETTLEIEVEKPTEEVIYEGLKTKYSDYDTYLELKAKYEAPIEAKVTKK